MQFEQFLKLLLRHLVTFNVGNISMTEIDHIHVQRIDQNLVVHIKGALRDREERVLTNAVHDPPSNSSKLKAVFQSIKANTNKSKILMVLALCILCLPGNIVTIWLKFTQYEEHVKR